MITTTYMGATEPKALDALVGSAPRSASPTTRSGPAPREGVDFPAPGLDDGLRRLVEPLAAALLDGLEWNVRALRGRGPRLIEQFARPSTPYWESELRGLRPGRRFDDARGATKAVRQGPAPARGSGRRRPPFALPAGDARQPEVERDRHGRHGTSSSPRPGTGKTVMAALDYRGSAQLGRTSACCSSPTARRSSTRAWHVRVTCCANPSFGEVFVGGDRPRAVEHVFATVQSLSSYSVENSTRALRRGDRRRVPSRRGLDATGAARPPRTRRNSSA